MIIEKRGAERFSCQQSAKIRLPVWEEEMEVIEISGTVVNISKQGMALEITDNNPSKSGYSNLLWERILCQESVSIELLTEPKGGPLTLNGVMTWNSAGDLEADYDDFSIEKAIQPQKYQVGFRFEKLGNGQQDEIESLIAEITKTVQCRIDQILS